MCTGFNVNVWPFPSLNVFSNLPKEKSGQWMFRIISEKETHEIDPGHLLPMDFFVARSFVGDIVKERDDVKLIALLDYVYSNLNEHRFGFDERWEKIKVESTGHTQVQFFLKVSKIEKNEKYEKYEAIPLNEVLIGEKSYVR